MLTGNTNWPAAVGLPVSAGDSEEVTPLRGRRFAQKALEWMPEIVLVVVTTLVGVWAAGRWIDPVGDPGFGWSLGYRLAEGDRLYRDVLVAYGPLSPYVLAAGGRLFGHTAGYVLVSNWIVAIAAGLLLLRCARPFLSTFERLAAVGMIVGLSIFAPGPGRLVLPYYPGVAHALALSLAAHLILFSGTRQTRSRDFLAGGLAGLAFCAKQEIGLAAFVALAASGFPPMAAAIRRASRLLAGFGTVVAAAAAFALSNTPVASLRDLNHFWPLDIAPPAALHRFLRSAAGMGTVDWAFDVRQTAWGLLVILMTIAAIALLLARERRFSVWAPVAILAPALLIWDFLEGFSPLKRLPVALSASAALIVGVLGLREKDTAKRAPLVSLGLFAALANLRTVFSQETSRHFDGPSHLVSSVTWVILLCTIVPGFLTPSERGKRYFRVLTGALLFVIGWNAALEGSSTLQFPLNRAVQTPRGMVFLDVPSAMFYQSLAAELRPGERVLVIPEINAVDVLFHVRSVSPLQDLLPGWLDLRLEKELLLRLKASPPDVVVLFERGLREFGVSRFGDGYGQLVAEWIGRNYEPVHSLRAGSILRRKPYHRASP